MSRRETRSFEVGRHAGLRQLPRGGGSKPFRTGQTEKNRRRDAGATPISLLWRRARAQRAQVSDDGDRVLVFQMVFVHGRANGEAVGADALLENLFALFLRVRRKSGDARRAHGPVAIGMDRSDPDRGALQPARTVGLAIFVAWRVAFPASRDFLDEITPALDRSRIGGGSARRFRRRGFRLLLGGCSRCNQQNQCGQDDSKFHGTEPLGREFGEPRGAERAARPRTAYQTQWRLTSGEWRWHASRSEFRVLQMERGRILIGASKGEQARFAIQLAQEREADGSAGAAVVTFDFALVVLVWSGRVVATKAVRQDQGGMASQIGDDQLLAVRRRNGHVEALEGFRDRLHGEHACAIGLNVFDGGNETRAAENVGPLIRTLKGEELVAAGAREFVESGGGFGVEQGDHRVVGEFGDLDGDEVDAHGLQLRDGGLVEAAIIFGVGAELLETRFRLVIFLFLVGRELRLGLRRFRRLDGTLEFGFQIADAKFAPVERGVPVEGSGLNGAVAAVGAMDGVEDERRVFHRATNGAELVHGPREGHGARARHEAEGGAQARAAAARARRGNRAKRFRADAEGDASGGRRGSRASG